jgi:cytochrome c2
MKKILKIALYVIVGALGVVLLVGAYIHFKGIPSYTPHSIDLKVKSDSAKVELGRKIATVQCNFCHYSGSTHQLTGSFRPDVPQFFGKIYSANITQDPAHGIGAWTDGQLAYFLRTGVKPNGKYAPPYMPKYPIMADEDLQAVIAFLRSESPLVKPSKEKSIPCEPSFFSKLLCNTVFTPLPYPEKPIPKPAISDKEAYGKYLVTAQLDCYACHSADFTTNDLLVPEKSPGFMGGGNMLQDLKGNPIYSANLTMDEDTGIGIWTEEQFVNALKNGKRPDGKLIRYPMLPYSVLSDEEAKAIFAYLKSIPKISKKVPKT